MAHRNTLRYAFAITHGPNTGLRCGGWRIWTHNEDTYITAKTLGGLWKASLHADVSWRVALDKKNEQSDHPLLVDGHRNAPWEFVPTEFKDGRRLAFGIVATRGALTHESVNADDLVIEVDDRWDRVVVLSVWMTEPGVTLDPAYQVIGGPLPLTSGRSVWTAVSAIPVEPIDPEPVPASTMIEPVSPEQDDVAAPGFLIRAVNIG